MRLGAAATLALLLLAPSANAQDDVAVTVVTPEPRDVTIVVADPAELAVGPKAEKAVVPSYPLTTTVVYVYPTTPQTFVPVAMLPSFLVQPGAPLPEIANYVVQSVPIPVLASDPTLAVAADLDCGDLRGPVYVGATDPHGLDKNDNGIGCEPSDLP